MSDVHILHMTRCGMMGFTLLASSSQAERLSALAGMFALLYPLRKLFRMDTPASSNGKGWQPLMFDEFVDGRTAQMKNLGRFLYGEKRLEG